MNIAPSYYLTKKEMSPQSLVLTTFSDDGLDITSKSNFKFVDTPPEGVKILKNVVNISKKVPSFSIKIKAMYKSEESIMSFVME